jgi:hypothetical protein
VELLIKIAAHAAKFTVVPRIGYKYARRCQRRDFLTNDRRKYLTHQAKCLTGIRANPTAL